MNDVLTRQKIIDVAEGVFRRFGSHKTNVVDVARELGVSHGAVYRHFGSKAALRDAVVEGWLRQVSDPLQQIAASDAPPEQRLQRWFETLRRIKRKKIETDPQLFNVTREIFGESRDVVKGHKDLLVGQLARMIRDGVAAGVFRSDDPAASAEAVFDAMSRYHDPVHAGEWSEAGNDAAFERVYALVMAGLRRRPAAP